MDLARTLAADLRDLAVDLSVDGYTRTTVEMIEHDLRRSVTSILGASITLCTPASPQAPVVLNFVPRTLDPDEIGSAIVVPLRGLSAPRTGTITIYASEPEAFTTLLPQLACALHLDPAEIDQHPPRVTAPLRPSVEGLHDFSIINRAFGVLLNRGHTLDSARAALAHHAELEQIDLTGAAHAILGSTRPWTSLATS